MQANGTPAFGAGVPFALMTVKMGEFLKLMAIKMGEATRRH